MSDTYIRVAELLLLALLLHTGVSIIGKHSDAWLKLVDIRQRPWVLAMLLTTVMLLAAIHLIR